MSITIKTSSGAAVEQYLKTRSLAAAKIGTINRSAQARAALANPLASVGQIGNGRRADNIRAIQYGSDADYLSARIARDRPDIVEGIKWRRSRV